MLVILWLGRCLTKYHLVFRVCASVTIAVSEAKVIEEGGLDRQEDVLGGNRVEEHSGRKEQRRY